MHVEPVVVFVGDIVVSDAPCGVRLVAVGAHPSCVIHVRRDVMEEMDGPMLQHQLQGSEGQRTCMPSRRVERPDEGRLAARFR